VLGSLLYNNKEPIPLEMQKKFSQDITAGMDFFPLSIVLQLCNLSRLFALILRPVLFTHFESPDCASGSEELQRLPDECE
jgi:hypothetical protein